MVGALVVSLTASLTSSSLGAAHRAELDSVKARIVHELKVDESDIDKLASEPYRAHFGRTDLYIPTFFRPEGGKYDLIVHFHGLSAAPFSPDTAAILMRPVREEDVEIKPDGIIYLPEIKYRRILNEAFGPGGWGLAPRGELVVGEKVVTREYALIVHGRFIAQARGECQYFSQETIPTAGEGCKSNALLRCCKDLGIASELWDPRFIRAFKKQHCREAWVEHVATKKRRQIWLRKDCDPAYPYAIPKKVG